MKRMQSMLRGMAAAAVSAATIVGCGGSGQDAPPAHATTVASSARQPAAPVSPASAVTGRSAGHAELEALGTRLFALEQAMARLEQRLGAGPVGAAPRQPAPAAEALSRRNDPTQRAQEEREMLALNAERDSAFRAEPIDPRWARSMQSQLQQALTSGTETPAPTLRSIECRSRTCRVELLAAPGSDLASYLPTFASRLGGQLDSMASAQVDLGNGTAATVIYLSS